jgi:hypothetical protein
MIDELIHDQSLAWSWQRQQLRSVGLVGAARRVGGRRRDLSYARPSRFPVWTLRKGHVALMHLATEWPRDVGISYAYLIRRTVGDWQ